MNYFDVAFCSILSLISIAILPFASLLISGCHEQKNPHELHFATFAEYPPFEYGSQGEIKGFDIDLAKIVAKKLGKKAVFDNMQFSTILPAVSSGQDDAAIATITITPDRKKNFDFTTPYYFEGMAAIYKKNNPAKTVAQLADKKMAAQLGSVMEIWLRKHFPDGEIIALNSNNQAIEALIAGHVDVVLMDGAQGAIYSQKHPELSYKIITKAKNGYGIALKKGSPLTAEMNQALKTLESQGEIEKLKSKWLGGASCSN